MPVPVSPIRMGTGRRSGRYTYAVTGYRSDVLFPVPAGLLCNGDGFYLCPPTPDTWVVGGNVAEALQASFHCAVKVSTHSVFDFQYTSDERV